MLNYYTTFMYQIDNINQFFKAIYLKKLRVPLKIVALKIILNKNIYTHTKRITMKANTITKDSIDKLVKVFYPTILADEITAPFFVSKIGADINSPEWVAHLELLSNFWAMQALGDLTYTGSPLAPHFGLEGLDKKAFTRWLELFDTAIDKVYEPQAGAFFKERAQMIGRNFMINLGIS